MSNNSPWKEYFNNTKGRPPRALLVRALPYVHMRDTALDLGSGALNDSLYLLENGFGRVTAVDKEPIAREIAETLPKDRFAYIISSLEDFDFPINVDLVNAQYSIPFVNPKEFHSVFKKIVSSLAPGGIFTGQFFGDRDEWSSDPHLCFHTKIEAMGLLAGLNILWFEELENDRPTAAGIVKHWHVFDFIAKKPI